MDSKLPLGHKDKILEDKFKPEMDLVKIKMEDLKVEAKFKMPSVALDHKNKATVMITNIFTLIVLTKFLFLFYSATPSFWLKYSVIKI